MQTGPINDKAINLSATTGCDADHAPAQPFALPSSPSSTSLPAKVEIDTIPNATPVAKSESSAFDDASLTETAVAGRVTVPESMADGSVVDPLAPKRSLFYRIRASNHFVTLTILLCLFTDILGYGLIIPIMPFIIRDMGGDASSTGVLIALYGAGIMVASPVFGIISDKLSSRRKPMMYGFIGLLIATVIFMLAKVYWLLVVARFFQGVAGGAVWTLGLALMADVFPADQMGVQMGKALIGHTMGLLGGPPIGGLLHDHVGPKAPFYFLIIFICIATFCLFILIEERGNEAHMIREWEAEKRAKALAEGIELEPERKTSFFKLMRSTRLIAAVCITTLEAFDLSTLEPTLPMYLNDRFGLTEGQIGLVFIAFTLPTCISPLAGWISDRYGARYLCAGAVTICGVLMMVLSITTKPLWGIVINLVGIGAMTSCFIAPVLGEITAVVRRTGDKAAYARAFAIFNLAFSFGMLIGPIIAGVIYQYLGFKWNCITTGCVLFAFVPLILFGMGDRKAKMEDLLQYSLEEEERQKTLAEIAASKISA